MKIKLPTTRTIILLIFISSIGYSQTQQKEASNNTSQEDTSEEYTEAKFQGEEEIDYVVSRKQPGMRKTANGWEHVDNDNYKSKTTAVRNNQIVIDRKQFVGNYNVKMNIDGMNTTFFANVSIVKGKLKFIINEGGSMNTYYQEVSVKEIQKNIQYDFKANDLDSGDSRIYHFKKKGNRFELKFNY